MNRKWIAILLAAVTILSLAAACGSDKPEDKPKPNPVQPQKPKDPAPDPGMQEPVFPNSLATVDADVAIDDLFAVMGRTEAELKEAMRDVATLGDGVENAYTYRHRLLGHDADVSYSLDDDRTISKVTVLTDRTHMDDWRRALNNLADAVPVEGMTDAWDHAKSMIRMTEDGDRIQIILEKPHS